MSAFLFEYLPTLINHNANPLSTESRATKAKEKQLKQQDDELRKLEAELRGGVSLGDDDQDDDGASTVQPEQPDESIEDMLGSLFKTGRKDTPEKFVEPEATQSK